MAFACINTAAHILFPVEASSIKTGFTTSNSAKAALPQVKLIDLSDEALGVHRIDSRSTHNITTPPPTVDGYQQAWEAFFPEGCINPGNKNAPLGGFGFHLTGPNDFKNALSSATHVLMSYEVLFESGWEWRKGGKLPGIYGGVGDAAYNCTGGRQSDGKCFNLRLMWREKGAVELYTYLPLVASNTERLLRVPPKSIQHPDFGFSVGRGAHRFTSGEWHSVTERVKLNTVGRNDGEIELYIDGRSVLLVDNLVLRDTNAANSHVHGLHFQTFFGGHSAEWASPKTQRAWFTNICGAILEDDRRAPREDL